VLGNGFVAISILVIWVDKDHIEPGEDSRLEIDVPAGGFQVGLKPKMGLAAASTDVQAFRIVVIPALAMEIVRCSITSWITTRSSLRIVLNSSI
jgi:hypothetical protein